MLGIDIGADRGIQQHRESNEKHEKDDDGGKFAFHWNLPAAAQAPPERMPRRKAVDKERMVLLLVIDAHALLGEEEDNCTCCQRAADYVEDRRADAAGAGEGGALVIDDITRQRSI